MYNEFVKKLNQFTIVFKKSENSEWNKLSLSVVVVYLYLF